MLEINKESAANAAKLNSFQTNSMNLYKKEIIDTLTKISGLVDPYSMEFIRNSEVNFCGMYCLVDILYGLSEALTEYQICAGRSDFTDNEDGTRSFTNNEGSYSFKLDVRHLTEKLGIEAYGRLFKFLEKMTVRFIDHPQLLVIDKLKYNSFNGSDYLAFKARGNQLA